MPASGYKSITVREKYYDDLKAMAEKRHISITQITEWLIEQYTSPYVRAVIDEMAAKSFEIRYQEFVLDYKIKRYLSTAWIRSEDYAKTIGPHMLVIEDRVRHDPEFCAERVFIVSKNAWGKKEVWKMIAEWVFFRFLRENQFKIFVLREKIADRILTIKDKDGKEEKLTKYYDMGIYEAARDRPDAEATVGYLDIDPQSRPRGYRLIPSHINPQEVKDAERYFADLKKHAQTIEKGIQVEKLEEQSYDERADETS